MKVFIVQGEHAYVPGTPMSAHATMASANREAASLVTIMLRDCGLNHLIGSTNKSNWKSMLHECNKTRNNAERGDFAVQITPLEVRE